MDRLDKYLEKIISDGVIPGINYGIIADKKYVGSVGYKQLIPNIEKNDINTIYDLASLTKTIVTVTLICKLVENQKLNYDDKVKKYLPLFKYNDVTIYHLLTHTSGLPAEIKNFKISSRQNVIDTIYSMDKIYDTGKGIIYSDIGFILLGFIIEKIYKKTLDQVAKEEIFIPLEMNSTCYNPNNKELCAPTELTDDRGIVKGFVHDEKCYSLGGVSGSAGLFSNIYDIMNFIQMILNKGIFNGKRILNEDTIKLWTKSLVYEEERNRTRSLCWITNNNDIVIKNRNNVISFNGFTGPSISIDFNNNIGIVLLTNRVHPTRDNKLISQERSKITDEIYKILKDKII